MNKKRTRQEEAKNSPPEREQEETAPTHSLREARSSWIILNKQPVAANPSEETIMKDAQRLQLLNLLNTSEGVPKKVKLKELYRQIVDLMLKEECLLMPVCHMFLLEVTLFQMLALSSTSASSTLPFIKLLQSKGSPTAIL